jgi:hypothetical protein
MVEIDIFSVTYLVCTYQTLPLALEGRVNGNYLYYVYGRLYLTKIF